MGKTLAQLRREVKMLERKKDKDTERSELIKKRNQLKYGKYTGALKGFGKNLVGGVRSIDRPLVPQAYKKKKMKTTGTKHFKSKAGYMKWLAHGHIHEDFKVPGNQKVFIRGKLHKVKHKRR